VKSKLLALLMLCIISTEVFATVGLGGFVPFPTTTMKKRDGGSDSFGFEPMVYINHVVNAPFSQLFLPTLGFIKSTDLEQEYSKNTIFFLWDLGYKIGSNLILRYGLGTFITKIKGDGAAITVNNGSTTATAYRPSDSITSYNTTVNIGAEMAFSKSYAIQFETYIYQILSGTERDFSYSLSGTWYL